MNYSTLIDAPQLQALLTQGTDWVLIDCRFDLADTQAGEQAYTEGHLPGAIYAHLDRDLSAAKTGRNGRHPLPDRAAFARCVGQWGVTPSTQVVAYDAQGGMYAARLWWMMRDLGHEAVAVLNGGLSAYAGTLTSSAPTARTCPSYPIGKSLQSQLNAEQLLTRLGRCRLVDARAGERFRGEVEPLDTQAGHIPGASNRNFKDNLRPDGRFKSAAQLAAEWMPLLAPYKPQEVVHQCGSGVTACHNLLALEYAGLGGSILYPGSWSEWSSDPTKPVAKG